MYQENINKKGVKVLNRNIIYSNNIFDKDYIGCSNITKISNVNEYFEKICIDEILKSNKDVKFYLVQYSKINEALYFFTDKKLNKEKYEEVFSKNYTYSKKRVDILKDIKQIFKNKTYQNEDFVTLNNIRKSISNMDKDNDSSYTKVNIESINSPFYVSLTKDGTLIFLPTMFYLNYKNNEDTIKYILDISNIKEVLNQNENKLYDRIVVSKKDLPKQLQNEINKLNTDKSLVRKLIDYLKK